MKFIKSSYEIIEQQPGEIGMLKHIEAQGRVAWKSEERITDESYIKFVEMLKGVNHGSVLEHGTVYLHMKDLHINGNESSENLQGYYKNKYSVVKRKEDHFIITDIYITTNYRVLVENNWLDDLKYQCEPTEFHEKRVTVKFICDRGVSHEFVRHRVFSFTQESTRYCNYSKDKFGNELTFIIPCWITDIEERFDKEYNYVAHAEYHHAKDDANKQWYDLCLNSEFVYNDLVKEGWKPQQARAILPNSLKTELIMTGFVSDWKHFFMLRCAPGAHPQAQEIAIPLEQEFKHLGLI